MPTQFSAGRAYGRSLSILVSNAGAFVLMTVLIQLPVLLYQIYLVVVPPSPARADLTQAIVFAAEMVLSQLATAAVTWGVIEEIEGKPAGFGACLAVGLARTYAAFSVWVVTGLITLAGFLTLCAPGLVAFTALFVAVPVAVVEGLGVEGSIRRSLELTQGSRWSILKLFGLMLLPLLTAASILQIVYGDPTSDKPPTSPRFLVANLVLAVLFRALFAVAGAVTYAELRAQAALASAPAPR